MYLAPTEISEFVTDGPDEWTVGGFFGGVERRKVDGDPCWDRTSDSLLKRQVLYRLS